MNTIKAFIAVGDESFFRLLNVRLNNRHMYDFMNLLTKTMDPIMSIIVVLAVFMYLMMTAQSDLGLLFMSVFGISEVLIHLLKRVFTRKRPHIQVQGAQFILDFPKDVYSFPSGHTGSATSLALVLSLAFPQYHLLFSVYAGLIAVSRVYLGYHYPTDVIVGVAIPVLVFRILRMGVFL